VEPTVHTISDAAVRSTCHEQARHDGPEFLDACREAAGLLPVLAVSPCSKKPTETTSQPVSGPRGSNLKAARATKARLGHGTRIKKTHVIS
jgi:hypothetical protein